MTENQLARKYGIPKWLRQYHTRYAKTKNRGIEYLLATHRQNPALTLNHGRDRTTRLAAQMPLRRTDP